MVVGEGGSSEEGHVTHPEVRMELVPYGPEGLDREFPAEHKEVMPHLVLKQPRGSERYKHLKDTQ